MSQAAACAAAGDDVRGASAAEGPGKTGCDRCNGGHPPRCQATGLCRMHQQAQRARGKQQKALTEAAASRSPLLLSGLLVAKASSRRKQRTWLQIAKGFHLSDTLTVMYCRQGKLRLTVAGRAAARAFETLSPLPMRTPSRVLEKGNPCPFPRWPSLFDGPGRRVLNQTT